MLELAGLVFSWQSRRLLDGVSLRVARGETVAVLGPSGQGKSTLLAIVAGLVAPDKGRVSWNGTNITAWPPESRGCGVVFQDFALFEHLNAEDNVAFGLIERGWRRAAARDAARAMLERMGLADRARSAVSRLSGGEQQRVALARALVISPRVLLLDEPFSALDASRRDDLQQLLGEQIAREGPATLLVTHDEAEARALAARGLRLTEGHLHPLW